MHTVHLVYLVPLIAISFYKLVAFLTTKARHNAIARNLGCRRAPKFPDPEPSGIANVVRIIQANNKGRLPEHIQWRFNSVSKQEGRPVFTFRTHVLRNWLIATCDPKNIQAILATQFNEFELGPIRFGTFAPL
jgi:hypothetical protein